MGGSGGSLGSYLGGAESPEEVLLRIGHVALESSVNLLLQQEGLGLDRTDEETDDPRLKAIRIALSNGIGDLTLQPLGGPADRAGNIDVLVVIAAAHIHELPPSSVINIMEVILREAILPESDTESVGAERFAVVVKYTDNTGFRLTPVISADGGFAFPSLDAMTWVPIGTR